MDTYTSHNMKSHLNFNLSNQQSKKEESLKGEKLGKFICFVEECTLQLPLESEKKNIVVNREIVGGDKVLIKRARLIELENFPIQITINL
jgi:hypothetical protein